MSGSWPAGRSNIKNFMELANWPYILGIGSWRIYIHAGPAFKLADMGCEA